MSGWVTVITVGCYALLLMHHGVLTDDDVVTDSNSKADTSADVGTTTEAVADQPKPEVSLSANSTVNETHRQVVCQPRLNNESDVNSVRLVSDKQLQDLLKHDKSLNSSATEAACQVLYLYAPWCPFSAQLAPHYNALSRAFPDIEFLAINALTLNYWSAKFGTVAVPDVLLFHNGKFVTKFNQTEKNLSGLVSFLQNATTLTGVEGVALLEPDYEGPVPTQVVAETDYYLILSWAVILLAVIHGYLKFKHIFGQLRDKLANLFHYDHPHHD